MFVKPIKIELITSDDSKVVISLHPSQKWELTTKDSYFIVSRKNIMLFLTEEEFHKSFQEKRP